MSATPVLSAQPLSPEGFAPYGWMLGKPYPADASMPAYTNPATDFWREHLFDTGSGGDTEVLWVNYRNTGNVPQLEKHLLTQQAIVPLTGEVVHVVAGSTPDGAPDLASLAAFVIVPGQGICMAPHCWHATRVTGNEVTCLMLTRRSTTLDLIGHLSHGAPAQESAMADVPAIAWRHPSVMR